jgi:hypothetical protein
MDNKPEVMEDLADETVRNEESTKDEIILATKVQTSNKARGTDNVPREILKKDLETTVELLYPLFVKIWKTRAVSED